MAKSRSRQGKKGEKYGKFTLPPRLEDVLRGGMHEKGVKPLHLLRFACFDIETTALEASFGRIVCACVKFSDEDDVKSVIVHKYADEPRALKVIRDWYYFADVIVGWNSKLFDIPFVNGRLMHHGFPPLDPIKMHKDLMFEARKLRLRGARLENVSKDLRTEVKKYDVPAWRWTLAAEGDRASIEEIRTHCVAVETPVLRSDLTWVEADNLRTGDKLVGFDEDGPSRKYCNSVVVANEESPRECIELELDNGDKLVSTTDHLWLGRFSGYAVTWRTAERIPLGFKLPKLMPVWQTDMSNEAGWLAGFFDGEGSLGSTRYVTAAQRPGAEFDKAVRLMEIDGYNPKVGNVGNGGIGKHDCLYVRTSGGAHVFMRFLGKIRPQRLLSKFNPDELGRVEGRYQWATVTGVRRCGVRPVSVLTTTSKTFIANGYPAHNCEHDVLLTEEMLAKLRPLLIRITR